LLAEYDEVLSEVIALPARATKYLSPKVQNELVGLLSKSIACTAKTFLEDHGINFSKNRGQGYDGAGGMSCLHAGVQTLINMVDCPVSFVHCGRHN